MDDNNENKFEEKNGREGQKAAKRDNQIALQRKYFKEKADSLKINPDNKIISIRYLKSLVLAGKIAAEDVAVIKQQEKGGENKYLVLDKDAKPVATIDKDFNIQIDPGYMKQYEGYVGLPGKQTESQKDMYDYDRQYKCEHIEEQEHDKKQQVEDKKRKFSHLRQDIGPDITAIIEIENKAELGAVLDQDIPSNTRAYIVQFSDGTTRICLEQGETVKEVATDVHTRQIEDALGKSLNMNNLDGTKFRANEFRAAEKSDSDKQLIIINPESSGRDQVIESEGTTGRVRTGTFVKDSEGKMTQLKGNILYPEGIQTEIDLQNYVKQDTSLDEAIEAQMRLDLIKEAQRLKSEIESIKKSDINVKDKHNMLNEKRNELEDILAELGMDYDDAEEVLEHSEDDSPDTDDGERVRRTPEEEALARMGLL